LLDGGISIDVSVDGNSLSSVYASNYLVPDIPMKIILEEEYNKMRVKMSFNNHIRYLDESMRLDNISTVIPAPAPTSPVQASKFPNLDRYNFT
jgi:hypothetical protein